MALAANAFGAAPAADAGVPPNEAANRKRTTMNSVLGKITVHCATSGDKIGQWGGTEAYLSNELGLGPCLIVTSLRFKRGQGTKFALSELRQDLRGHVPAGKFSIRVKHQKREVFVMVSTDIDKEQLQRMSDTVRNRNRWDEIEADVSRKCAASKRGRTSGSALAAVSDRDKFLPGGDVEGGTIGLDGLADPQDKYAVEDDYDADATQGQTQTQTQQAPKPRLPGAGGLSEVDGNVPHAGGKLRLSNEQDRALRLVLQGQNVFVTGAAGCGKSEWLRQLIAQLPPGTTAVTAATGIAARAIGGVTLHSFAGIGRGDGHFRDIVARVKNNPDVVGAWRRTTTLIIDEISMVNPETFDLVDQLGRFLRNQASAAFGGMQVVCVGDFLQLPPVDKSRNGDPVMAFHATAWKQLGFKAVEFRIAHRQRTDNAFVKCLDDVRWGNVTPDVDAMLRGCVVDPEKAAALQADDSTTMLVALNADADECNEKRLDALQSDYERYQAIDTFSNDTIDLDRETMLPQSLTLKIGAKVVVTVAVPSQGLRNGDVGIVEGFAAAAGSALYAQLPRVRFPTHGDGAALVVVEPTTSDVTTRGVRMASRTMLPLRLAWALTAHKCQGMTLDHVVMSLDRTFFEYGQAYVALSRVRGAKSLSLTKLDTSVIRAPKAAVEFALHVRDQSTKVALLEAGTRK